ncbi:hypothetical protein [Magnetospirillum sp. UT-4]|uniref:hypothetical protein n=1 Tax=Magnetospirillum sp. UT-4 TaxID=2681467 RepID=UPI001384298F|nr:hypothetical protein [Magnetospirillum sp. UT-4]CAA7623361.1 exported hypothetical protein [Magnetospirillum sp. UT-4]
MNVRAFFCLSLALTLGGCTHPGPQSPPVGAPGPGPTPRPAAQAAPAAGLSALRPPPRPAAEAPPQLVGLSDAETLDLLGQPQEEAEHAPGKVWVYAAGGCRLSVHLFPDMDAGGFHALDYTASGDGREACLAKVAAAARRPPDA